MKVQFSRKKIASFLDDKLFMTKELLHEHRTLFQHSPQLLIICGEKKNALLS